MREGSTSSVVMEALGERSASGWGSVVLRPGRVSEWEGWGRGEKGGTHYRRRAPGSPYRDGAWPSSCCSSDSGAPTWLVGDDRSGWVPGGTWVSSTLGVGMLVELNSAQRRACFVVAFKRVWAPGCMANW